MYRAWSSGSRILPPWCSGVLLAVLAACAQPLPPTLPATPEPVAAAPEPEPDPPQPAPEPPTVAVLRVTRNDQVVLLPNGGGGVGKIMVRQGTDSVLLDQPYAAAHIEGPGLIHRLDYDPELLRLEFGPVLAALPQAPSAYLLYFLEGDDRLTAESESQIERIFVDLATRSAAEISVIGHTDSMGSTEFNDKLSLQRAEKIRGELIRRGIPADNIAIAGRGERELLVPTDDGVAEPRNRRVEINIR
jgi:outer membrane protein OmpA-like peptidoglycan-associated protein